ncbi:uncharacterized protein RHOBADRAFT_44715 [Rhodotorula graminis WP1]|uniref:Uncharacterized protein n=1 Tax=Rhodotorula graminis (strain WP1) TaxID=578459 RepID=A0A194S113_RHOGW|nr:uncharacterized protein RHOBADRAFT_44715 [Rhodotorula graminis WP1]KPV74230.1 hypothetical protein RHOBADRAFT_44715 [Rhodotorula graminis WP1]
MTATLSALDLASLLTGYLSRGPHPWMLVLWLLGDAAQLAGMYIHGALETQKLSAIWFAVGDIIIVLEMAIGRGLVPGTSCWTRRKLAKTHTPVSVGEDQDASVEVEDVGWGATPVAQGSSEKKRRGARTRSRDFVGRWMPDVDGPRVNAAVLAALLVVGLAVWGALDVAQRDKKPALEPGERPQSTASWIGWGTALGGTILYNFPRLVQIRKIVRDKGLEHTSVWMFMWLAAQNYTMLISILTVSHTLDAGYGQAPFLINVVLALTLDHVIVSLWLKYRHTQRPDSPQHLLPHPTQAGVASLLSRHSRSASLLPPSPPVSPHELQGREKDNERVRRKLADSYTASLERERARAAGRASNLPVLPRRALARRLDAHAVVEKGELSALGEHVDSSGDEAEQERHATWARQSARTREELQRLRLARHKSDARAEAGLREELGAWKEERARRGLPLRSEDEDDDSGFSSSQGHSSSSEDRPLTSRGRAKEPRRGVGTLAGRT